MAVRLILEFVQQKNQLNIEYCTSGISPLHQLLITPYMHFSNVFRIYSLLAVSAETFAPHTLYKIQVLIQLALSCHQCLPACFICSIATFSILIYDLKIWPRLFSKVKISKTAHILLTLVRTGALLDISIDEPWMNITETADYAISISLLMTTNKNLQSIL